MADSPKWEDTEEVTPSFDDTTPAWDDTEEVSQSPKDVSMAESALRGTAQGLTAGTSDELGGAIQAGLDKVYGLFGESPSEVNARLAKEGFTGDVGPTTSSEMYTTARDEERAADKAAEAANPYTYKSSELFSNILTGVATGGAGASALGVKGGATLASKAGLQNAAKLGTIAGLEGAAMGAGKSEADTVSGVAKDALISGAVSAPLGALAPAAGNVISSAYNKSAPGVIGAGIGGVTGYNATSEDADALTRLENTAKGAAIGGAVGLTGQGIVKGAKSMLGTSGAGARIARAAEMGLDDVSLMRDADRQAIFTNLNKEQGRLAADIQGATDAVAQKEATKLQKIAEKEAQVAKTLKESSDLAEKQLKESEKKLLQAEELKARTANLKQKEQAAKAIDSETKKIIELVDKSKEASGKTIENAYDSLEKAGMAFDPTKTVDNALTPLSDLAAKSAGTGQEAWINMARGRINDLMEGGADISTARRLKATITELINSAPDNNVRRILSNSYKELNSDIAKQAQEQGFKDISDSLAKGNQSYHSAMLIENTLGRKFNKGVDVDPRFIKTASMLEGSAKTQTKAGKPAILDKVQQDLSGLTEGASDPLFQRAREAANIKEQLKVPTKAELKARLTPELESQRALTQSQLAEQEALLQKQLLEETQALGKQAAPTAQETAALDLEKLVGKQTNLSDEVAPSEGVQKWSRSLVMPRSGNVATTSERVKRLLGEQADDRIKQLTSKEFDAEVVRATDPRRVSSTASNPVSSILALMGGVGESLAIKGANLTGQAARSLGLEKPSKLIIKTMQEASPEGLAKFGNYLIDKAPTSAQRLIKAAESTDPIKRRATLFLVSQDPEFRRLMQDLDNPEQKETDVEE